MSVALISLYDHWSAGNRSLQSVMMKEGIETDLIFFHILNNLFNPPTPESFNGLLTLLKDLNPEVIGLSIRSQFWWIAVRIAQRVKKEMGVPVVFGGVHATLNPEECIEVVDIVCRGEGEAALPELVRRLRNGQQIHDIPGLWSRSNGDIIRNSAVIAVKNLDTLPLPVIDRSYCVNVEGQSIKCDPLFDNKSTIQYMISGSRGCPFRCSFCCESVYKDIFDIEGSHIRRRSVEHLFEEFRFAMVQLPNLQIINFTDEVFHPPAKWMEDFTQRYREEVGLFFSVMIHPGLVSDKWIKSLEQTGSNFQMDYGLQSGSARVRKEVFDRPTSDKAIDEVIKLINRYSFAKVVDIIVDNPFETPEEFRETVKTLLRIKRPLLLQVFAMMFYPGLTITNRALEAGYAKDKDLPGRKPDIIELWIPSLEDPDESHLKSYLKTIVHLHQLKMRSIISPLKEWNPVPIWLLKLLSRKKNASARNVKRIIWLHNWLVKRSLRTYLWAGRIQTGRELLRSGKIGVLVKRFVGLILRGGRRIQVPAKNEKIP